MNCNRIQDLIITDYIDGQMVTGLKTLIDQHLAFCPECKEYLSNVQKETITPFENAAKEVPDEILWARIKENIDDQKQRQLEKALKPDLWERLKAAVHIPRPAFALATIITMIFMISSTGQLFFNAPVVHVNGQDQVEYIGSLIDDPVGISGNNGNDPQTPIEKYFL